MASVNRVVLIGNLTRDPELRHTQGGTAVCEFGIAVNSREKGSDGEWGDRADFFDVTVWGEQGEAVATHLRKGAAAGVDGRLRQERWEKDGTKHSRVKVVADTVQFLGGKPDSAPTPAAAETSSDDDIPF